MAQTSHFTATITVSETVHTAADPSRRDGPPVEVAKVVVRADNLADLRSKIAAHVALI